MGKIGLREWFGAGRAIASGDLIRSDGPGQYCAGFESRLAAMMGSKHALSVNSGTSALTAALAAAEFPPRLLGSSRCLAFKQHRSTPP